MGRKSILCMQGLAGESSPEQVKKLGPKETERQSVAFGVSRFASQKKCETASIQNRPVLFLLCNDGMAPRGHPVVWSYNVGDELSTMNLAKP